MKNIVIWVWQNKMHTPRANFENDVMQMFLVLFSIFLNFEILW